MNGLTKNRVLGCSSYLTWTENSNFVLSDCSLSPSRRPLFGGWHFFSPAHVMKLVEIVRGTATSMETICVMQRLTKRVGKIGVVVGNCDGFVGNRLLISYGAETTLLLEEGVATVSSVDKAFLKFGIALGPFQMADLAGLDVGYNIRKQRGWVTVNGVPSSNKPDRYPEVADVIVSEYKRLGQKSGKVSFLCQSNQFRSHSSRKQNLKYWLFDFCLFDLLQGLVRL